MSRAELEKVLTKERVSKDEISKLIQNLEMLEKAGMSKSDQELVIKNLIKDPPYRALFIKDYRSACNKVGVEPIPTP
ncbi:MAG: hypothetical protein ACFFD2_23475 [Promethearchaeota archaeon]